MTGGAVRVFNVNKAVGRASSGVEYAQRYRREILAGIDGVDDRWVFTDYIPTNLSVFSDPLGFPRERVIWVYNVLSGRQTRPSTVRVEDFLARIGQPHTTANAGPDCIEVTLSGSAVRYRIRTLGGVIVDRVETVVGRALVRVARYDASLNNVEHLHENRVVRRVFHAPDGRVAAEQHYRDGEITRTRITPASPLWSAGVARRGRPSSYRGDLLLDGRSTFLQAVFAHLFDCEDDVVIVDRALEVIDAVYPVIGERCLYCVVHAEHYDLRRAEDGVLLWNNHYENVFTRPDMIDGIIVSTRRQQGILQRQLTAQHGDDAPPVAAIPVGAVPAPAPAEAYEANALVTASRLADEKHIDILIRAVAIARGAVPGIRLDIYGEGKRDGLLAVIEETGTQDCVRLMGHRELRGVLGGYALYVSASTSEGFGLSLLEAMSEGLPIVGFDVDYGNREMVTPGGNGLLVPRTGGDDDACALAAAMVEALTSGALERMRAESLRRAEAYAVPNVRRLWEELLREEGAC